MTGGTRAATVTGVLAALAMLAAPSSASARQAPGAAIDLGAPPERHSVFVEAGNASHAVDDAFGSPLRYSGTAFSPGIGYAFRGEAVHGGIAANLSRVRLTPSSGGRGGFTEEASWFGGGGWLLWQAWRSENGRAMVLAGPAVAIDVGLRTHRYGALSPLDLRNGFAALQAAGDVAWRPNEDTELSARLGLPVAGVSFRTPYEGSRGPAISVDPGTDLILVSSRLQARYHFRGRIWLRAFHEVRLLRHDDPFDLTTAGTRAGVGAAVVLGGG